MFSEKIALNELNPSVPITLFYGDYETNNVFLRDTLTANKTYSLKNTAYSVRAKYKAFVEGDTVTVYSVDGDNLTFDEDEYCDGSCYDAVKSISTQS